MSTAVVVAANEPRAAPVTSSRRRARTVLHAMSRMPTTIPRGTSRVGTSTPSGMVAASPRAIGTAGAMGREVPSASHAAGSVARKPITKGTSITSPVGSTGGTRADQRDRGADAVGEETAHRVEGRHDVRPGLAQRGEGAQRGEQDEPGERVPPPAFVHPAGDQRQGQEHHHGDEAGHEVAAVGERVVEEGQDDGHQGQDDEGVEPRAAPPHRMPRAMSSWSRGEVGHRDLAERPVVAHAGVLRAVGAHDEPVRPAAELRRGRVELRRGRVRLR